MRLDDFDSTYGRLTFLFRLLIVVFGLFGVITFPNLFWKANSAVVFFGGLYELAQPVRGGNL